MDMPIEIERFARKIKDGVNTTITEQQLYDAILAALVEVGVVLLDDGVYRVPGLKIT